MQARQHKDKDERYKNIKNIESSATNIVIYWPKKSES